MSLISYLEFDALRLREFAGNDPCFGEEEEEHGTAFLEQIRGVSFARARSRPEQLHTVDIEFKYAPSEVAAASLHRLGLDISAFDSSHAVEKRFGTPVKQATWPPDYHVAWFEVGGPDRYLMRCGFGNEDRLDCLVLCRLDFPMDVSEFA